MHALGISCHCVGVSCGQDCANQIENEQTNRHHRDPGLADHRRVGQHNANYPRHDKDDDDRSPEHDIRKEVAAHLRHRDRSSH